MGQEQSYSHASVPVRRYKEPNKYEDPIQYRTAPSDYRTKLDEKDYKRHKSRKSVESFQSETAESGYRSGSISECRSTKSDYYCTSLYKNDHYRDVNKELYKPVKIPKEKRYKIDLFDEDLKTRIGESEASKSKNGIRNYTPKILSEEDKTLDNWI